MPPVIPLTTPQQGLPSALGAPLKQADTRVAGSIGALGNVLIERGKQLKDEHDLAVAKEAFINFRGLSRDKYAESTTLQGKDAAGVGKDYNQWYNEESGKVFTELENATQENIFEELAVSRRERDLDSLAVHEATEHKKYLVSMMASTVTNSEAEILVNPFSQNLMDDLETEITLSFDAARPGLDNSPEIQKAMVSVKFIALQEQIKTSPEIAKENLKKWKDDLGTAYQETKDMVDNALIRKQAAEKFPDSFAKQREWVSKQKGVSDKVKTSVRQQITADKETKNALNTEQINKIESDWFDLYVDKALDINTIEQNDAVPTSKKNAWRDRVKTQQNRDTVTAADRKIARGVEADLTAEIDTNASEQMYDTFYDDYTGAPDQPEPATMRTLRDRLRAELDGKGIKQAIRDGKTQVKNKFNRGDFGDITKKGTRAAAKIIQADILIDFDDFAEANPTASSSEVKSWLDSKFELVAAEASANQINGVWDAFADVLPFRQSRRERLGELDDLEIARRLLINRDVDVTDFSDEELTEISGTKEFNQFKTQLLTE